MQASKQTNKQTNKQMIPKKNPQSEVLPLYGRDPKRSFGGTPNRTAAHTIQPPAPSTQHAALRTQHPTPNTRAGVCVCVWVECVCVCVCACACVGLFVNVCVCVGSRVLPFGPRRLPFCLMTVAIIASRGEWGVGMSAGGGQS